MNRLVRSFGAFGAVCVFLAGCGQETAPPMACADLTKGCTTAGIEVRADQPPSALHPFLLSVHAPGAREVSAEFVMQGMEMGLNRYRLMAQNDAVWQARVTLPVSSSACSTTSRLRSTFAKSIDRIMQILS